MARQSIGGPRRHVKLSNQQDERLVKLAKDTGITVSEHMRRAVDAYFRALDLAKLRVNK